MVSLWIILQDSDLFKVPWLRNNSRAQTWIPSSLLSVSALPTLLLTKTGGPPEQLSLRSEHGGDLRCAGVACGCVRSC